LWDTSLAAGFSVNRAIKLADDQEMTSIKRNETTGSNVEEADQTVSDEE